MLQKIKQWLPKAGSSRLHRKTVGIDIGTAAIKVLELQNTNTGYQIKSWAIESLPASAIVDKEIKNPTAVIEALKSALNKGKIQGRSAVIAIPDAAVISKVIQLDAALSESDIEKHIKLAADKYISYPISDLNFDFQIQGLHATNPELMDVLLVAARKKVIAERVDVITASGLEMSVIDVESYALERLFFCMQAIKNKLTIGVVDLGVSQISLLVFRDGLPTFFRSELFFKENLSSAEIQEKIGLQIKRLLQFYLLSQQNEITDLYLIGGLALLPGIAKFISEQLNITTQLIPKFHGLDMSPDLALCCGLALRGGN